MKTGCCTVCLEPLFKDLQVATCGHVFHRTCIFRWIDRSCSCPNCKQHLDASELTTLFLKPAEIIKEVLGDPTVLEDADPELLLAITKAQCGSDDDDDDESAPDASDPDTDLELLDLSASKPSQKKAKKKRAKNKMALISEKIRSTALNRKAEDLEAQLNALSVTHRAMEEAKAKLHRKIQGYLKSAQTYEKRYFDADDEVKNLTRQLFRKNKEMNELKRAVESMAQRMAMLSHAEQILAGNFDAVRREEETAERSRSKEEQERYYRSMYDWLLKEYKRCQSDRERDKKLNSVAGKKWAGTFEEQRVKIEELTQGCMAGDAKVERYKKAYFDLKDKYKKLRERAREMNRELKELKRKGDSNNSVGSVGVEHGVEDVNMAHGASACSDHSHGQSGAIQLAQSDQIHETEQKQREHSVSRSYDDENAPQLDISRVHDEEDREEKYKAMTSLSQPTPVRDNEVMIDGGVFGIPSEDGMGGFRRDTASLFGAYRQIKSRGGGSNPFSNGGAAANRKKRSFSQLTKGNDGRGGTATFMKANINAGNQRANKRRRVVSSSSSSNSNSSGTARNRGGGNGRQTSNKGSVSKFFDRFMNSK